VTPEQRELVMSLVIGPGEVPVRDPIEVLEEFGASDGQLLSLDLLRDAANRKDSLDVEMALIVADVFGVTMAHREVLSRLVREAWHVKHEDVVSALGKLSTPQSIPDFVFAASWVPEYLLYDDSRALARKAIHALGNISGPEAETALSQLLSSSDGVVREQAAKELSKRRSG
jgi:hypothetical protein